MAPEMPFRLECGSIAQKCLRHLNYFIAREQVEQKKKQNSVFGFRPLVVWFVRSLWSICSTWGRTFSSTSELGLWNFDSWKPQMIQRSQGADFWEGVAVYVDCGVGGWRPVPPLPVPRLTRSASARAFLVRHVVARSVLVRYKKL